MRLIRRRQHSHKKAARKIIRKQLTSSLFSIRFDIEFHDGDGDSMKSLQTLESNAAQGFPKNEYLLCVPQPIYRKFAMKLGKMQIQIYLCFQCNALDRCFPFIFARTRAIVCAIFAVLRIYLLFDIRIYFAQCVIISFCSPNRCLLFSMSHASTESSGVCFVFLF